MLLASATADAAPTITIVPSPSPNPWRNALAAVDAHGGKNVWAVGYQESSSGLRQTLIERWNGTSWVVYPSPNEFTRFNRLMGVANVPFSKDSWAVGDGWSSTGPYLAEIVRWQGSSWQTVAASRPGTTSDLYGVAAVSTSDAWAVGEYTDGATRKTLIERWDGTSWSQVPSPSPSTTWNVLKSVSVVAPTDVWAVGFWQDPTSLYLMPLVEHWDGVQWTIVPTPDLASRSAELDSVVRTGTHVWAVGDRWGKHSPFTLVERLTAKGTWKVVPSPNAPDSDQNFLASITAVPGGLWAVGYDYGLDATYDPVVMKWDGSTWTLVPTPSIGLPAQLFGASTLQGDLIAVGDDGDGGTTKTLVERGTG